jgi:mycofactocin system transcriptional regulator
MASSAKRKGFEERDQMGGRSGSTPARVGRRRTTTPDHITDVALDLFATYGFSSVSVDDVAQAAGIARRTLFRYYSSKNAIPWGDFDGHLQHFRVLLAKTPAEESLSAALRGALLAFNTFDESEQIRHRQRMQVILQTAELQAYSMTMYAGWRGAVAAFVAHRTATKPDDLMPQTIAWQMLGVALSAYEYWLANESTSLPHTLGDAFDTVAPGLESNSITTPAGK